MNIFNLFKKDVPKPPYDRYILRNLDEKEYPKYLKEIYKFHVGKRLNLKHPKTFSEKIQWLKLYDTTPLKTQLTDKVLVRDWVKDKIGEEYLKPVLQICKSFEELEFDKFPNCFILKANHGCKWHYKIKDKEKVLSNEVLMTIMQNHFDGWMHDNFFTYAGFELQYKNIDPQIIAEPLLLDNPNEKPTEIEVYCFDGKAKISQEIKYTGRSTVSVFDENLKSIDLKFKETYTVENKEADDRLRLAVTLSEKLSEEFKLVRVDWLIYHNKIYFNEMTFTPFSGFYKFEDDKTDKKLGKMLNLK